MSKITLDADLRGRLNGLNEPLELCDEQGVTVGHVLPTELYHELFRAWAQQDFSKEEIELARQEVRANGGLTTSEAISIVQQKIVQAKNEPS